MLLEVAGLARSTFYYHQARMAAPDQQAPLKDAIRQVFWAARGRYGHRRVHAVLRRDGLQVAKKTVLKLMRAQGLECRVRRRRRFNSFIGPVGEAAPNLLGRNFTTATPNSKWVTDVTEFHLGNKKLFLSPVLDLFDRSIVSYSLGPSPTVELTATALREAITTLEPGQHPLVHSDQGFQYRHASWKRTLTAAGATASMSRKATCLDNAVMENFFGHLKSEMFHGHEFETIEALTTEIDDYMTWYNTERISTTLGDLSPHQYRQQTLTSH